MLATSYFRFLDHVDAEALVDAVGCAGSSPRHIESDLPAAVRRRVPVEALHPSEAVTGDDQPNARVAAFECAVEDHRESPLRVGTAVRRVQDLGKFRLQRIVDSLLVDDLGGDSEVAGAPHGLAEVSVLAPHHLKRSHVDYDITPGWHTAHHLADHRIVAPQRLPPLAAEEHDDSPAAG